MSLGDHLASLLGGLSVLEPLDVALPGALRAHLAADVTAPRPMPHYAMCQFSGYAVRSSEVTAGSNLQVVGQAQAGDNVTQPVYAGVCVAVQPGAPLPSGADAVVPAVELAPTGGTAAIPQQVAAGYGVVAAGSEAAAGAVLLPAGRRIDSRAVGLLAAAGISRVAVRPPPRVVVVSVGNGLAGLRDDVEAGKVFDAAGPMLQAVATEAGAMASRVGPIPSLQRDISEALEDQLVRADLLVVCGGSEPGDQEVRRFLSTAGRLVFDEGSTSLGPFGHGSLGEDHVPVLALPANAVRAAMLFAVLADPMMRVMQGMPPQQPLTLALGAEVPRHEQVTALLLARIGADGLAQPLLSTPTPVDYAGADAIIRILPGAGVMPAGSRIPALRIGGGRD